MTEKKKKKKCCASKILHVFTCSEISNQYTVETEISGPIKIRELLQESIARLNLALPLKYSFLLTLSKTLNVKF